MCERLWRGDSERGWTAVRADRHMTGRPCEGTHQRVGEDLRV